MRSRRSGFTIVEMCVLGGVGLVLAVLAISLLVSSRRADEHTAGRLDGARTAAALLAALRRDTWSAAGAFAVGEDALTLEADEERDDRRYSYRGAHRPVARDGANLGAAALTAFRVIDGAGALAIELALASGGPTKAEPVRMTVPVVVPGARERAKFEEWAASEFPAALRESRSRSMLDGTVSR
jgi:hypothetical protein